jgi:hypothetical protein
MTLLARDKTYHTLRRNDVTFDQFIFEDIRVIHGTQSVGPEGHCCYASVVACRRFTKESRDSKMGICHINFSRRTVKFTHYLDLRSQKECDKNWGLFLFQKTFYAMYSSFPLAYTRARSLDRVAFRSQLPDFAEMQYSISCNPLQTAEDRFLMVLHRKLAHKFGYEFWTVEFKVTPRSIKYVSEPTQIRIQGDRFFYFCSSLIRINAETILLMGANDAEGMYLKLPGNELRI